MPRLMSFILPASPYRVSPAPRPTSSTPSCLLARVIGVGIETADMLVHEVLSPRAASRPTSFTQRR